MVYVIKMRMYTIIKDISKNGKVFDVCEDLFGVQVCPLTKTCSNKEFPKTRECGTKTDGDSYCVAIT